MKSPWKTLMFTGLMFGLSPLALSGCEEDSYDDAADDLEDATDDAVDDIEDGADEIGDDIEDGVDDTQDSVDDATN